MTSARILAWLLLTGAATQAQVNWPTITLQHKPWSRWWWEGSAVQNTELTKALETYQKAGLGGLEIVPIYGVKGYEKDFLPYLSPRWMNALEYTLKEAKRLNMGIDMSQGSGWPFGGPWVKAQDAAKTVYYKIYALREGESVSEKIVYDVKGFVRTANPKPLELSQVKEPLLANKNLQELALDQIQYPAQLKAEKLVAQNEEGRTIDLMAKLDAAGNLSWKAPAGRWKVIALFEGMHGKLVERAAPAGEGYAIDHFSKAATERYLSHFDQAFRGHTLNGLRAMFNDSYEVDDARGQSNWTPELFSEFRKHRGYPLEDHLMDLLDQGKNHRGVLYDYRLTMSELLQESYTAAWRKWANQRGYPIRNQSHGSPGNILDLYATSDIPETEGRDIFRFKFASSAAHVTGKPLVSCEAATWLHEHFVSTLGDVRKAADQYFLGGVNHLFYHGIEYSPSTDSWPGWLFYAAVHFQPTNPFWHHFPALNQYIARSQSFLQQGKANNDVLLYYPLSDKYNEPGRELLQHFDGMEKGFKGTVFEASAEEMQQKGYTYDYISDKQILTLQTQQNKWQSKGGHYQTLVLPAVHYLPLATQQAIWQGVQQGATVIFYKNQPDKVPGLAQHETQQAAFDQAFANLKWSPTKAGQEARLGKGRILLGNDLSELLEEARVRREAMADEGIQFSRRVSNGKTLYFLVNANKKTWKGWLPLATQAKSVALYDAFTGDKGLARLQEGKVWVQLAAGASLILETTATKLTGTAFPYYEEKGAALTLKGPWKVSFLNGGPTLPKPLELTSLKPWTDLNQSDLNEFSGLAQYQTTFAKPAGTAKRWVLKMGRLNGSAEVVLNGKSIRTLLNDHQEIVLQDSWLKATNTLVIKVANSMANRIIPLDKSGGAYKKFYNINFSARLKENVGKDGVFTAEHWKPFPSGLEGEISISPID